MAKYTAISNILLTRLDRIYNTVKSLMFQVKKQTARKIATDKPTQVVGDLLAFLGGDVETEIRTEVLAIFNEILTYDMKDEYLESLVDEFAEYPLGSYCLFEHLIELYTNKHHRTICSAKYLAAGIRLGQVFLGDLTTNLSLKLSQLNTLLEFDARVLQLYKLFSNSTTGSWILQTLQTPGLDLAGFVTIEKAPLEYLSLAFKVVQILSDLAHHVFEILLKTLELKLTTTEASEQVRVVIKSTLYSILN
eukprot:jgi/Hompol1/1395/HPOL_002692-RA